MRILRGGSAVAVAALALGLVVAPSASATVSSATTVEELPFAVDSSNQAAWWNPLDVVGETTFFAFNAPAAQAARHEVHLASRSADGAWTEGCLRASAQTACVTFVDDNGHNQPSIVVDGDGIIHAFVSMHNEQWNYFRSDTAGDVRTMVDRTATMPDLDVDITYPVTARGADGDAWVLVRTGTDADGAREGVLYRYDRAAGAWTRETTIAAAKGYSFYPDDLEVSPDGRVHVLWEWGPFPADPARHLGSYAVYDPATGSLTDAAGATLVAPITPATAGSVIGPPVSYRCGRRTIRRRRRGSGRRSRSGRRARRRGEGRRGSRRPARPADPVAPRAPRGSPRRGCAGRPSVPARSGTATSAT